MRRILALVVALAALGAGGTTLSGATFTSQTTNSATISAAPDWTPPRIRLHDIASPAAGLASATVTATDAETGVDRVRFEFADPRWPQWVTICDLPGHAADTYSCGGDTRQVPDGTYRIRAQATDHAGYSSTSAVATIVVENDAPAGADVQANLGNGALDAGDTLTLGYTRQVDPGSVLAGWDGRPTDVTLQLVDGGGDDSLHVVHGTHTVNLGSVALNESFLRSGTVDLAATMTATTATGAVPGTAITLTVRSRNGKNGWYQTSGGAAAMTWTPSAAARGLGSGKPTATSPATETGAPDVDF